MSLFSALRRHAHVCAHTAYSEPGHNHGSSAAPGCVATPALPTREVEPSTTGPGSWAGIGLAPLDRVPTRPREKGLGITWLKSSSDPPLFPFERMKN